MTTITSVEPKPSVAFPYPEEVIEAFTHGDCWALARAFSDAVDLYPVTISAKDDCWFHAGTRLLDGRIVDIEGIWEEEAWLAHWDSKVDPLYEGNTFIREWSGKSFAKEVKDCFFDLVYPEISEDALCYAEDILAELGITRARVEFGYP